MTKDTTNTQDLDAELMEGEDEGMEEGGALKWSDVKNDYTARTRMYNNPTLRLKLPDVCDIIVNRYNTQLMEAGKRPLNLGQIKIYKTRMREFFSVVRDIVLAQPVDEAHTTRIDFSPLGFVWVCTTEPRKSYSPYEKKYVEVPARRRVKFIVATKLRRSASSEEPVPMEEFDIDFKSQNDEEYEGDE